MLIPTETLVDAYLESRLKEWAEWLKTANAPNIFYPRQSSIAMFMEGKAANRKGGNSHENENNELAEAMEKMVVQMGKYKPIMADCLRRYYLDKLSLRASAKQFGISHAQYGMYVQMAKQWLLGKMNQS